MLTNSDEDKCQNIYLSYSNDYIFKNLYYIIFKIMNNEKIYFCKIMFRWFIKSETKLIKF
jgi:hypothetical protein